MYSFLQASMKSSLWYFDHVCGWRYQVSCPRVNFLLEAVWIFPPACVCTYVKMLIGSRVRLRWKGADDAYICECFCSCLDMYLRLCARIAYECTKVSVQWTQRSTTPRHVVCVLASEIPGSYSLGFSSLGYPWLVPSLPHPEHTLCAVMRRWVMIRVHSYQRAHLYSGKEWRLTEKNHIPWRVQTTELLIATTAVNEPAGGLNCGVNCKHWLP